MSHSEQLKCTVGVAVVALIAMFGIVIFAQGGGGQAGQGRGNLPAPVAVATTNAMINPYRMLPNWPHLLCLIDDSS